MIRTFHYVDAFVAEGLQGNRACVVELSDWLSDDVLQAIAREVGLPETSFVARVPEARATIALRWFSQRAEVDLCGHGTLATAYLTLSDERKKIREVTFSTKSGPLSARLDEQGMVQVGLPRNDIGNVDDDDALRNDVGRVAGQVPNQVYVGLNLVAVYAEPEDVQRLVYTEDIQQLLTELGVFGLAATAPAGSSWDCDFVTRFFTPAKGVPEDPVTGSIHCALAPFWADQFSKDRLVSLQLSKEGGRLDCEVLSNEVVLRGHCRYSHFEERSLPLSPRP